MPEPRLVRAQAEPAQDGPNSVAAGARRDGSGLPALRRCHSQFKLFDQRRTRCPCTNLGHFPQFAEDRKRQAPGTLPATQTSVSQFPAKSPESLQARVELLAVAAKKHNAAGNEAAALECYKEAASLLLGAPWLQHRTAELARKLKQLDVAAVHYRRAAAAFIAAGFPKRALSPLRNAWQASLSALPDQSEAFVAVTLELAHAQRDLGFGPEAALYISNANQALRASGSRDRMPSTVEAELPESGINTAGQPSARELLGRAQAAGRR